MSQTIANWARGVIRSPNGGPVSRRDDSLVDSTGRIFARMEDGVLRFALPESDASIAYYRSIGGAHFHERSSLAFTMSSLDTPVYHEYLRQVAPERRDAVIVDVGGGDGRNALPWLEWGYKRIIVIDAVAPALWRFRDRIAARDPAWLKYLFLIEADARAIPLRSRCADLVLAIESLYYLNEDYERGLRECRRLMRQSAVLLLADRDYEGGLLTRLLFDGGLEAFLDMGTTHEVWDGVGNQRVRSRCFTREELMTTVKGQGLCILEDHGVSLFSLVLSFLSKRDRFGRVNEHRKVDIDSLLARLGKNGAARRCHVLITARGRRNERSQIPTVLAKPRKLKR